MQKLFIGSSTESRNVAYALQENLEHDFEVTPWDQGVFELSKSGLESLVNIASSTDLAVIVFTPDDVTNLRGKPMQTARDNVVFELGLFVGRLGRERTFIVKPRSADEFHLPTDLLGITPAEYDPRRSDGNLKAALGPAANKIREAARKSAERVPVQMRYDVPNVEGVSMDALVALAIVAAGENFGEFTKQSFMYDMNAAGIESLETRLALEDLRDLNLLATEVVAGYNEPYEILKVTGAGLNLLRGKKHLLRDRLPRGTTKVPQPSSDDLDDSDPFADE